MTDVGLVPYGRRSDGSYGLLLDNTDKPLVSVCEVLNAVPANSDPANFPGRLVFSVSTQNVYVFTNTPSAQWISLLQSVLVTVAAGPPPVTPTPVAGAMYYDNVAGILYLYDGTQWQGVGGNRGSGIIWQFYTGDGATSLFATGATTFPPVNFVSVYINGISLSPGTVSTRDYFMVGNNVQLNQVPAIGAKIAVRTMTFVSALRNSTFVTNRYVADGTTNSFNCGVVQANPAQVFVYVDGVMQQNDVGAGNGTFDYKTVQQNVIVASLISAGTVCTMTSVTAHNLLVGQNVTISGALQTAYNGTFVVTAVPNPTTLQYVAGSVPSSSPATPNPTLTFGPITQNDSVTFFNAAGAASPPPAGAVIHIRGLDNVAVTNTTTSIQGATNLDGGGAVIFAGTTGVNLNFKSLLPGNRIQLTSTANDVTIASTADAFITYTSWNGTPNTYVAAATDRYIGSRNASGIPVVVDIATNIPAIPANTGRILTIKDEAKNAGTSQISVTAGVTGVIDGQASGSPYVMNTNGAAVTLLFDGAKWHVIDRV